MGYVVGCTAGRRQKQNKAKHQTPRGTTPLSGTAGPGTSPRLPGRKRPPDERAAGGARGRRDGRSQPARGSPPSVTPSGPPAPYLAAPLAGSAQHGGRAASALPSAPELPAVRRRNPRRAGPGRRRSALAWDPPSAHAPSPRFLPAGGRGIRVPRQLILAAEPSRSAPARLGGEAPRPPPKPAR